MADSTKPKISAHRISHVIDPAKANARPIAPSTVPATKSFTVLHSQLLVKPYMVSVTPPGWVPAGGIN